MANFSYLLVDEKSKEAAVVDSGWEIEPIVDATAAEGAVVKQVFATHGHFDHTSTIEELAGSFGAKVVAHENSPIRPDVKVHGGQRVKVGETNLTILHTPGHTEDSISLYDGRHVFTGDTLFVGTIGRFEPMRAESMFNSLHRVILGLPVSTVLYPGHDYGDVKFRTLGEEKSANPYLIPSDLRSFLSLFSLGSLSGA